MARLKGFEPLAHGLEGRCSILLSYRHRQLRFGAGDGNRTHATSLEGWDSTIELHPHFNSFYIIHCASKNVNNFTQLFLSFSTFFLDFFECKKSLVLGPFDFIYYTTYLFIWQLKYQ